MKTLNSKKSYLFLAFFLLGLSYLIPKLSKDELTFKKEIPETNTRRNLLNKKVKKNLYRQFIPVDSSLYSHYLYDFLIKSDFDGNFPNSDKLIPNINGVYSSSWRIKFTEPGDLYYEIPKNYKNFDLYITDVNGLPIYRSSEMINLPDNYIKIKPGIYKFKLNSQDKLSKFKFNFESLNKNTKVTKNNLITNKLNINFGESDSKALKRLILLAKKSAKDNGSQVISNMPSGRINSTIVTNNGKISQAQIGLSGRTIQHFSNDFPSIDVRLKGGDTYRGLSSFKLYQLSTKSGLKDFVFLSVLKDLGYIIPRQEIINLVVNGDSKGLFLLMENFNESTFTKQHKLDGNVIGLNTSKLFYNYPLGSEIELDYFYKIPENDNQGIDTSFFISNKFTKQLDKNKFAKYIAFASIYYSTHGLGIDDLRFYQDPATGKFIPIPRDMNPGLGADHVPFIRNYSTHLGWLSNMLPYTIDPARNLEHQLAIDSGSNLSVTGMEDINNGLTDIHFSIITFLSEADNLNLTNRYLNYFAKNLALQKKIKVRMINALKLALEIEPDNSLLLEQYREIQENEIPFLGTSVKNQIYKFPPIITENNKQTLWNLRTSTNLDKNLNPSFFSPFRDAEENNKEYRKQLINSFVLEKEIYKVIINKGYKPKKVSQIKDIKLTKNLPLDNTNLIKNKKINQNESFPKNIATFLGYLPIEESDTLALFIVRNATNDVENFTLSRRNDFRVYKPEINHLFKLNEEINNLSTTNQILQNKYSLGETYRLLAFKFEYQNKPIFFRFNLPRNPINLKRPKNAGWFGPSQIYLPIINSNSQEKEIEEKIPEKLIKSNNSWIIPEQTNIELLEDLIIPANVSLTIEADSKIKIKEGKSIVIYGDLFIKGTNNKPVIFSSLGSKPWGGLFAGGTSNKKSTVEINSAIFKDFGSFPKTKINKMNLNGGLTFYKTKLIADNIRIENALSEDGMNIIYSQAKISNLSIKNSYSDGIDLDYTDADIKNIQIENNRGDGLDISGSLVKCSFCIFLNNKDKGVSIGEMSNFYANNSIFMNNDMGLANKDQSVVNLSNSLLKNNRIGLAEFIKKPYFGKPKSNLLENKYINNNFDYKWLGLYFY